MAVGQDRGSSPDGRADHGTRLGKYVGLASEDEAQEANDDANLGRGGLTFGITSYHYRLLTESQMNGGGGYTYEQVGMMSPDQICHRLCDKAVLKEKAGRRVMNMAAGTITTRADGTVNGRAEDGTKITGKIAGKSLARQLMEQEEAKAKVAQEQPQPRRRRRHG